MAYKSNDISVELLNQKKGKKEEYLKAYYLQDKDTPEDTRVDIREYYTHEESGDVLPGKKGIRVSADAFVTIAAQLIPHLTKEQLNLIEVAIANKGE